MRTDLTVLAAEKIMGWMRMVEFSSDDGVHAGHMPADATIAEAGRGWCWSVHSEGGSYPAFIPNEGDTSLHVSYGKSGLMGTFDPLHEWDDAGQVVERMIELGFFRFRVSQDEREAGGFFAEFLRMAPEMPADQDEADDDHGLAWAPHAPEAITKAALKALGELK